jgi:hypothetical protein
MSMDVLSAIMTNPANALDCTATAGAPDRDCGSGFVLADRALGMALDATPPVVTPALSPTAPDGANQWYRGPVTVSWSVSDGESPVTLASACAATAPGDSAAATVTCTATSAGGSTTGTVTLRRDSTPPAAPTIAGVAARTYSPRSLPRATALACRASDPTSGIDSCTVTGYGTATGRHTLTAVALNDAGLTSTSTLSYSVAKPAAISRLVLRRGLTLARLARSGAALKLRVASPGTHLAVSLVARVGTRRIALGRLTKRAARGQVGLRVHITPKARRQLEGVAKAVVEVTVTGTSAGTERKTLRVLRTSGR